MNKNSTYVNLNQGENILTISIWLVLISSQKRDKLIDWSPNERSVPQGSMLGPCFLISLQMIYFYSQTMFSSQLCRLVDWLNMALYSRIFISHNVIAHINNNRDDNTISLCSSDIDQLIRIMEKTLHHHRSSWIAWKQILTNYNFSVLEDNFQRKRMY